MERNRKTGPQRKTRLERALYCSANRVYYFTIRAFANQEPFDGTAINDSVLDAMREQAFEAQCHLFTYCLMPDHLHYLCSPDTDGVCVLDFVDRFKGRSTNSSWNCGWEGKLWQPGTYDHIVRKNDDLREIAQYILNNPVRKGLVETAEQWRWSGHMNPLPLEM